MKSVAKLLGKKIKFKAEITKVESGFVLEPLLIVTCSLCNKKLLELSLTDEKNLKLLHCQLSEGRIETSLLKPLIQEDCEKSKTKKHKLVVTYEGQPLDFSTLTIRSLDESFKFLGERKAFLVGHFANTNKALIECYLFKNKRHEVELLITKIWPVKEEDEVPLTYEEVLKEGEKLKERLEKEIIKIETKEAKYHLLKSDGIQVSPAGWFIDAGDIYSVAELFFAFTHVEKNVEERKVETEEILPFLLIYNYNRDGNIISKQILPLHEVSHVEIGNFIAKVDKKTLLDTSLTTQLSLDVVEKLEKGTVGNIDIKQIFSELVEELQKYIFFENSIFYKLTVLWIIGTFFSDVFKKFPTLFIIGPSGTGKTRLTTFIVYSSHRGFLLTDPTDTNLPRIIGALRPTLAIDDLDEIMRKKHEAILSILKHAYKSTVFIPRLEKTSKSNKFLLLLFNPFSPIVMNSIEPLVDTQHLSRVLVIQMKKPDDNEATRIISEDPDEWTLKPIRDKLYILRFKESIRVYKTFKEIQTGLTGRNDEIWRPILTIAKLVDEGVFQEVKDYAISTCVSREELMYEEERLILYSIERIIIKKAQEDLEGKKQISFTASELREELFRIVVEEEKEMTEKEFERHFNVRYIGKILERLGIRMRREGKKREKIRYLTLEEFEKLKRTFVPEATDTNNQADVADEADVKIVKKDIDASSNFDINEQKLQESFNPNMTKSPNEPICLNQNSTSAMSASSAKEATMSDGSDRADSPSPLLTKEYWQENDLNVSKLEDKIDTNMSKSENGKNGIEGESPSALSALSAKELDTNNQADGADRADSPSPLLTKESENENNLYVSKLEGKINTNALTSKKEKSDIEGESPSALSALSAKDSDISQFKVELDEVHDQLMSDPEYYCLFWLLMYMQYKAKFGFGFSLNATFRLDRTKCKARAKVIFEEKYKDLIEKSPEEVIPILYQKLKERREAFIRGEFTIAPDADEPVDVKEIEPEPKHQPPKEKKDVKTLDKIVRQKDPGYYTRLEKDFIEVVKHPPLGKQIFDFEAETFLLQRGYEVDDIRKVAEKLIEAGVIIRFPDGKLDLNFSRLGG